MFWVMCGGSIPPTCKAIYTGFVLCCQHTINIPDDFGIEMVQEKTRQKRAEEFLKRARETHGEKFTYDVSTYVNMHIQLSITCPVHGTIAQSPKNHLYCKTGCFKCGKDQGGRGHRLSFETFLERANIIHGNRYSYDKVNYVDSFTPVTITCPKHGDFNKQPNDHLYHLSGCTQCTIKQQMTKGEQLIAQTLDANNIQYSVQHTFPGLLARDQINPLRYDFYIPDWGILIEFDGPHHKQPIRYKGTSDQQAHETHEKTKLYDNYKEKYALEHDLQLHRIDYDQLKDIPRLINDIIQKFIST